MKKNIVGAIVNLYGDKDKDKDRIRCLNINESKALKQTAIEIPGGNTCDL
jgi:hypothetical protein